MKFSIFITLSVIILSLNAQKNPLPLNIQEAYENETRSKDGTPGPKYWQNHADYKIDATLDIKNDVLNGSATITYFNDSPDTLMQIILRLYQDFFRKGNARQWPAQEGDITNGTQISSLKIDGDVYDPELDFPRWMITNFQLQLKSPVAPKSKTTIEIEWSSDIPSVRGLRMRKYDDGHYFIAYWYPQVAVYDDIDGWDRLEYLGLVEFYNDINNYDVKLTLPGDYMVWATGELQNREDILQKEILQRYQEALGSDKVIRIITQKDYEKKKVLKSADKHIWHFKADQVPDFSFGTSIYSNWDGVSLVVDKETGRRVLTDVAYPANVPNWEQGAIISRESVEYMSYDLPGVPFPYPHMTSFCAGKSGGGMETPMMANNGAPKDFGRFADLLFHEISHTYFPFYMGTNERKYAWMDEGWAAYLPAELSEQRTPENEYKKSRTESYLALAGQETELPLMVPSFQHNSFKSARCAAYNRPAIAYQLLRDALGDELFKKCLLEYINRWNGKHPIPYDFFNTFDEVSQQDLDWFWQPWFFETGYPDLLIKEVTDTKVIIEKAGTFPIPINLVFTFENGKSAKKYISTAIWKDGQQSVSYDLPTSNNVVKIELGSDEIPDVNWGNNIWER